MWCNAWSGRFTDLINFKNKRFRESFILHPLPICLLLRFPVTLYFKSTTLLLVWLYSELLFLAIYSNLHSTESSLNITSICNFSIIYYCGVWTIRLTIHHIDHCLCRKSPVAFLTPCKKFVCPKSSNNKKSPISVWRIWFS